MLAVRIILKIIFFSILTFLQNSGRTCDQYKIKKIIPVYIIIGIVFHVCDLYFKIAN